MKYMLFCCNDDKKISRLSQSEIEAVMDETYAVIDELRKNGRYITSERLNSVQTATMVRVRNGKVTITDGPFAETKEQIGGFWMIDARDLNEAIQVAAKFPSSHLGGIEVRPVMEPDHA